MSRRSRSPFRGSCSPPSPMVREIVIGRELLLNGPGLRLPALITVVSVGEPCLVTGRPHLIAASRDAVIGEPLQHERRRRRRCGRLLLALGLGQPPADPHPQSGDAETARSALGQADRGGQFPNHGLPASIVTFGENQTARQKHSRCCNEQRERGHKDQGRVGAACGRSGRGRGFLVPQGCSRAACRGRCSRRLRSGRDQVASGLTERAARSIRVRTSWSTDCMGR